MKRRIWDISAPLGTATPVYPGDAPFAIEWTARIAAGDSANVSVVRLSPHTGTHVDAPLHLEDDGADVASLALDAFVGRCRVVDVTAEGRGSREPIGREEALAALDAPPERVLFRTRRERPSGWTAEFRPISPELAAELPELGVRLVGTDAPSVDAEADADLPAHRLLVGGGTVIVENLDLSEVPAGEYELIALPLRLEGLDASPVRAVLRALPESPNN